MSNEVGELYNQVIETVIQEARNEFEETGDDTSVLEMLKAAWKKRLKSMNVTKEPLWEIAMPNMPNIYASGDSTLDQSALHPLAAQNLQNVHTMQSMGSGQGIPLQSQVSGVQPNNLMYNMQGQMPVSASHAAQNPALMNQNPATLANRMAGVNPLPGQAPVTHKLEPMNPTSVNHSQVQAQAHAHAQSQNQNQNQNPTQNPTQNQHQNLTQNASANGNVNTNPNPSHASNPIPQSQAPQSAQTEHQYPTSQSQPIKQEGNMFNPLDSSQPARSITLSQDLQNDINNAMNNEHKPQIPQTDGPQDEELNSDLDDSEDDLNSNDEDEDGEQTQIMLCLYEKVHKVKTRWKYTLKDGLANVNGLDYVFSKATGESEW